jgi:hypothetical protein
MGGRLGLLSLIVAIFRKDTTFTPTVKSHSITSLERSLGGNRKVRRYAHKSISILNIREVSICPRRQGHGSPREAVNPKLISPPA